MWLRLRYRALPVRKGLSPDMRLCCICVASALQGGGVHSRSFSACVAPFMRLSTCYPCVNIALSLHSQTLPWHQNRMRWCSMQCVRVGWTVTHIGWAVNANAYAQATQAITHKRSHRTALVLNWFFCRNADTTQTRTLTHKRSHKTHIRRQPFSLHIHFWIGPCSDWKCICIGVASLMHAGNEEQNERKCIKGAMKAQQINANACR